MTAAVFAGCGGSDSSSGGSTTSGGSDASTADTSNGGAAAASGNVKEKKADRITQTAEGSETSKKTLRICTWNEEFKNRLRAYYDQYDKEKSGMTGETDKDGNFIVGEKEYLKDGTEIEWLTTPNKDNAYQNKLDSDLAAQAGSDNKIDMFLIEADYALKYVNGPYVMPVKEVGLTDDDLKDQYQYTKDIVTDSNGELEGVSWQATPGLFAYKRSIAKDVLGTDDPDQVQAAISDWDKFNDVAAKMKEKGYFMLSGYDDSYRTFSNNVSKGWVDADYNVVIDDNIWKWVDQTKEYTDKGYNNKTGLWSEEWGKDQSGEGKVFGFFYSTWGINFTLAGNAKSNDMYYVCPGPQAYYWGGTWMCAADGTDNKETVCDIMKKLTCDSANMKKLTEETQDYTNNAAAMKELSNGFKSEFLGGQNHIALFVDAAAKIDASNAGPYDQGCNEEFQTAFHDYFSGKVDKDTALANFYKAIKVKYPNLKTPS
jgi:hypothetical protein